MHIFLPPLGLTERHQLFYFQSSSTEDNVVRSFLDYWKRLKSRFLLISNHSGQSRPSANVNKCVGNKSVLYISVLSFLLAVSVASATHIYQHAGKGDLYNYDRHSRTSNVTNSANPVFGELKPEHLNIPIGGVMHLFPRYGYLSLSMRVIGKADRISNTTTGPNNTLTTARPVHSQQQSHDQWIFLEPINHVVEPTTMDIHEASISSHENESLPFHNLFHIDLCEDVASLLEAYFKNFTIEGLDKPWQAFSGGWRYSSIARNFGIDQHYIEGDYRFILVKVLLVRGNGLMTPYQNISVSSIYEQNFQQFQPDNDLSTYEFFKVVGTHYVHSYIIGNAIYQVFVYDPDGFQAVKRRLFFDGIKHQSTTEFLEKLPEIFSMWVKTIGNVFILNSDPQVTEKVRDALTVHSFYKSASTNLLKLHNNPNLVREIEVLLADQPNGVLGIDLRGIHILFQDPVQRAGFQKALKHKMQLWEINFQY